MMTSSHLIGGAALRGALARLAILHVVERHGCRLLIYLHPAFVYIGDHEPQVGGHQRSVEGAIVGSARRSDAMTSGGLSGVFSE